MLFCLVIVVKALGLDHRQKGQTHQNNDFDFALFLDWHF
jgi:hypothetical protein